MSDDDTNNIIEKSDSDLVDAGDQVSFKLNFSEKLPDKYLRKIDNDSRIRDAFPSFWACGFRTDKKKIDHPNYKEKTLYSDPKTGKYYKVKGDPWLPTIKIRDYLIPIYTCNMSTIESKESFCVEVDFTPYLQILQLSNDFNNRYNICDSLARVGLVIETNINNKLKEDISWFKLIRDVEMSKRSFRVYFAHREKILSSLMISTPRIDHYINLKSSIAKSIYLSLISHLNDNYIYRNSAGNIKENKYFYFKLEELLSVCNLDHWKTIDRKEFKKKIKELLHKAIMELIGTNLDNNLFNCFISDNLPTDIKEGKSLFKIGTITATDVYNLDTYYLFTRGSVVLKEYPGNENKIKQIANSISV